MEVLKLLLKDPSLVQDQVGVRFKNNDRLNRDTTVGIQCIGKALIKKSCLGYWMWMWLEMEVEEEGMKVLKDGWVVFNDRKERDTQPWYCIGVEKGRIMPSCITLVGIIGLIGIEGSSVLKVTWRVNK